MPLAAHTWQHAACVKQASKMVPPCLPFNRQASAAQAASVLCVCCAAMRVLCRRGGDG